MKTFWEHGQTMFSTPFGHSLLQAFWLWSVAASLFFPSPRSERLEQATFGIAKLLTHNSRSVCFCCCWRFCCFLLMMLLLFFLVQSVSLFLLRLLARIHVKQRTFKKVEVAGNQCSEHCNPHGCSFSFFDKFFTCSSVFNRTRSSSRLFACVFTITLQNHIFV